jgi:hypothetical protein
MRALPSTELPCRRKQTGLRRALAHISGWSRHVPAPGSLPAPAPAHPKPAHPGHPGGPADYRGPLPGSRGVKVHDPAHPLPHTTARRPLCREVPVLPARHAGLPGRLFPAAARRGSLPSRNIRQSPPATGLFPVGADLPSEPPCLADGADARGTGNCGDQGEPSPGSAADPLRSASFVVDDVRGRAGPPRPRVRLRRPPPAAQPDLAAPDPARRPACPRPACPRPACSRPACPGHPHGSRSRRCGSADLGCRPTS